jgi:hypothetical protein
MPSLASSEKEEGGEDREERGGGTYLYDETRGVPGLGGNHGEPHLNSSERPLIAREGEFWVLHRPTS